MGKIIYPLKIQDPNEYRHYEWYCSLNDDSHNLFTIGKIAPGRTIHLNEMQVESHVLEVVVKGSIRGKINYQWEEVKANEIHLLYPSYLTQDVTFSPDAEVYIMECTKKFIEYIKMQLPRPLHFPLMVHRAWYVSEEVMGTMLDYIKIVRTLVEHDKTQSLINLICSILLYLETDKANTHHSSKQLNRDQEICSQFLRLISKDAYEHHDVNWYANQLCLTPKYLWYVVKKTMGESPNQLIDSVLISQAYSLIAHSNLTIQQIAEKLGFENQSHFGTFFKRKTGTNPSCVRSTAHTHTHTARTKRGKHA